MVAFLEDVPASRARPLVFAFNGTIDEWTPETINRCMGLPAEPGSNSPQPAHLVHEAADPGTVDRVPRVTVALEMGADDAAVGDLQDLLDRLDPHAGVGQHGRVAHGALHAAEITHLDPVA